MNGLVGKTILSAQYADPWGEGITITFTDGQVLHVSEGSQTGKLVVKLNTERVISDWYLNKEE